MYLDICQEYENYDDAEYEKDSSYPNTLFTVRGQLNIYDEEIYLEILKEVIEISNNLRPVNIQHLKCYSDEISDILTNHNKRIYLDRDWFYDVFDISIESYENLLDLKEAIDQIIKHDIELEEIKGQIKKTLTQ